MTVNPTDLPTTGLGRPVNLASDPDKTAFIDEDLALYDLYLHHLATGRSVIEGVTFTGCRIEGPAIVLVLDGTRFDTTNFGQSKGDMANLVLRPVGGMAIGSIPMRNCIFSGCEFYMLGFTGNDWTVDQLLKIGKDA